MWNWKGDRKTEIKLKPTNLFLDGAWKRVEGREGEWMEGGGRKGGKEGGRGKGGSLFKGLTKRRLNSARLYC